MKISLNGLDVLTSNSGVYMIFCTISHKCYIGSSVTLRERLLNHVVELDKNIHGNRHFQRAWNKYGKDSFTFTILEYCLEGECVTQEQFWLDSILEADKYLSKESQVFEEKGYNISPTASSPYGVKRSKEFKKKYTEHKKAWWENAKLVGWESTRQKMSLAKKGKKNTRGKKINCLNTITGEVKVYNAVKYLEQELGLKRGILTCNLWKNRRSIRKFPHLKVSYHEN